MYSSRFMSKTHVLSALHNQLRCVAKFFPLRRTMCIEKSFQNTMQCNNAAQISKDGFPKERRYILLFYFLLQMHILQSFHCLKASRNYDLCKGSSIYKHLARYPICSVMSVLMIRIFSYSNVNITDDLPYK